MLQIAKHLKAHNICLVDEQVSNYHLWIPKFYKISLGIYMLRNPKLEEICFPPSPSCIPTEHASNGEKFKTRKQKTSKQSHDNSAKPLNAFQANFCFEIRESIWAVSTPQGLVVPSVHFDGQ